MKKKFNKFVKYSSSTLEKLRVKLHKSYPIIKKILPIFLLIIIPLIFFRGVLNGSRTFFGFFDNSVQSYAWYQYLSKSINSGFLPLWDPNSFSGHSFIGEIQTGTFYPLNILLVLIFGNENGISLQILEYFIILHFFLASLFMYIFLRHLKLSVASSLIGSIVFSYIGFIANRASAQVHIFFGLIYIPLIFFFFFKYFEKRQTIYLFLIIIFLSIQILAGHVQPFLHTTLALTILAIYLSVKMRELTPVKVYLFMIFLVVPLSAIQLFPFLERMGMGYRWVGTDIPIGPWQKVPWEIYGYYYILKPQHLLNLVSPYFYKVRATGNPYFGLVPLVLVFIGVILYKRQNTIKKYFIFLAIAALLISFGHYNPLNYLLYKLPFFDSIKQPVRSIFLFHFAMAVLTAFGIEYLQRYKKIQIIFIIACILNICIYANALTPSTESKFYPKKYYQNYKIYEILEDEYPHIRTYDKSGLIPPNIGNVKKIQTLGGHGSTIYKSYFDYIDWRLDGKVFDRLNVKYIISKEKLNDFRLKFSENGMYLYERSGFYPKAYFEKNSQRGSINIDTYLPNYIKYEVTLQEDDRMIFSELFYPGWEAYVDGNEADVLKYDIFRAVDVQEGSHVVEFKYKPYSYLIGKNISMLTILGFTIYLVARFINSKKIKRSRITHF